MYDNPFNFFDKIFCINLQKRTDRWTSCVNTFKVLNIESKVTRLEASCFLHQDINNNIHIEKNLLEKYFKETPPNTTDWWNLRRAGCADSFLRIIYNAKKLNLKSVLIFEDDIALYNTPDTIIKWLSGCVEELPEDWEMFYLSANPTHYYGHSSPVSPYSTHLCKLHAGWCCHAVAINHNIYDDIINCHQQFLDTYAWVLCHVNFDTFCCNYIQPRQKTYISKKLLFTQYTNFSDIENCVRTNDHYIQQSYQTYEHLIL